MTAQITFLSLTIQNSNMGLVKSMQALESDYYLLYQTV